MFMKMPTVMGNHFSRAPQANIPRSQFDRSHGHKTTFDCDYLIPVFVDEVLPGDTFNCHMTAFARQATPLFPIMDNLYLDSFFFFVPNRLLWDNWEKFNGAQDNPDDSTDFVVPAITSPASTGFANGTLFDYMGYPTAVAELDTRGLFHRAYNLIWNEWFRDENLQDSVVVDKDNGPDDPTDYVLLKRGKRYDYFTSCLPWPQKGPAVELPLGTRAPVLGIGSANQVFNQSNQTAYESDGTSTVFPFSRTVVITAGGTDDCLRVKGTAATGGYPDIYADLSAATAATINQLRESFQIQKLYERDARGGTRYTEILRSHFGVISPDARLQRPEYLGGGSAPIIVTPIAQTSSTASQPSPQGNLAAFATCAIRGHGFTKSFVEHGVIIGMVCARADLTYQQGLPRMFSRETRFDFYWPVLSHIGEQAVLNKEIYAQATSADDEVFGYQERYAEYRYKPSQITGQFRSNFAQSLDSWHLSQEFGSLPVLNDEFIEQNTPMDRIQALVASYPHFIFDSYFKLKCARTMPVYSVPGLVDHF